MNKGKYRAFIMKVEGKVEGPKDYSKEAQEWLKDGLARGMLAGFGLKLGTTELRWLLDGSSGGRLWHSFHWVHSKEGHNHWFQRSDKAYPLSELDRAKLEALLKYREENL